MSDNLPPRRREALEWLEAIIAQWNTNFASIGLTSAQVTDLAGDITDARTDFTSVEQVRNDSKVTTQEWYTSAAVMRVKASGFVATIKGFAETSGDPSAVYTLAGLTGIAPRTPAAPPTQPNVDSADLGGDGSVTINFSGTGPTGTVWQVSRQLAGETGFTFVGNGDSLTKSFKDITVPSTVSSAAYRVQGVRGSIVGPASFPLTVQFGSADAGGAEAGMGLAA